MGQVMLSLIIVWILLLLICFNLAVLIPMFLLSAYRSIANRRLFLRQYWPILLLFGCINPLIAPFPWQLNRLIQLSSWLYVSIYFLTSILYGIQIYLLYRTTSHSTPELKLIRREISLLELVLLLWFRQGRLNFTFLTWCVLFCIMNLAYVWKYLRPQLTPKFCLQTANCLLACLPILLLYQYLGLPAFQAIYRQELQQIIRRSPPTHLIHYNSEIALLWHQNRIIYLYGDTATNQYSQTHELLQYPEIQNIQCRTSISTPSDQQPILCCIEGHSSAIGKTMLLPLFTTNPSRPSYQLMMFYKSPGNCAFINKPSAS